MSETTVVYIAGYGRSGSTLLDLLLGQLDGWFSMGEFRLFLYGVRDEWICGCGEKIASCPVWSSVVPVATRDDIGRAVGDLKASVRMRRVPSLVLPHLTGAHRETRDRFVATLAATYAATAATTDARVLVDSSKDPIYGMLLRKAPGVRVHVVHLVRDSRAVTWSWQRKRARPEIASGDAFMPTRSPLHTSLDWNMRNELAHLLGRGDVGYTRLTYEAMVSDPTAAVAAIARAVDGRETAGAAAPKTNHTVGGNPMRFGADPLTVRPDIEWRDALASRDRRLVTGLTLPLLLRYGYVGRRAR